MLGSQPWGELELGMSDGSEDTLLGGGDGVDQFLNLLDMGEASAPDVLQEDGSILIAVGELLSPGRACR